jgi:hypothetical protein
MAQGTRFEVTRKTLAHCKVCGQHEVEGLRLEHYHDVQVADVGVCLDCFTRALKLPMDGTVDRLRALIADLEHELARCRFPKAELLHRLKREAGAL